MLEFILSKTVLIVFSLAVLVAAGSMISSFYSVQENGDMDASLQQVANLLIQADASGSESKVRLDMREYLGSESLLRIGNGLIMLLHDGQVSAASLPADMQMKVLDETGLERTAIEVTRSDFLTIDRAYVDGTLVTIVYIEKVDATFSTALMNRSTSSIVL